MTSGRSTRKVAASVNFPLSSFVPPPLFPGGWVFSIQLESHIDGAIANRAYRLFFSFRIGDGLRHFGYQKERKFYNGVTMEDIHGSKDSTVNGIHGVYNLRMKEVDFASYA